MASKYETHCIAQRWVIECAWRVNLVENTFSNAVLILYLQVRGKGSSTDNNHFKCQGDYMQWSEGSHGISS